MPYALHAQLLQAFTDSRPAGDTPQHPARGDWKALREGESGPAALDSMKPEQHDASRAGPAVVHVHGGGMAAGQMAPFDRSAADCTADSGAPLPSVDHRRAPEHPHLTPVEGACAGGGPASRAALPTPDRACPWPDRSPSPKCWTTAPTGMPCSGTPSMARRARSRSLGTGERPLRAAARLGQVGELGISRNEDLACARRLAATGTPIQLHTHPGYPHAFDDRAPEIDVAQRAQPDPLHTLTGC